MTDRPASGDGEPQALTVPFTIEVYEGLGAAEGLLRLDGDALLLEFEVKDSLIGVLTSGIKQVAVPLSQVDSLTWKEGWLGSQLILQTGSLRAVRDVPARRRGQVRLSLSRKDREAARRLVSALSGQLGDRVSQQTRDRFRRNWACFRAWLADL